MKKVKKLKLKESVKDKIVIFACILLMIIGVIALQKRVEELDNGGNTSNDSIPVSVNFNK
jgi:uncharacterized membrane protein